MHNAEVLQELAGNLAAEAADLRRRVDADRPYCRFEALQAAEDRDAADGDVLEAAQEKACAARGSAASAVRNVQQPPGLGLR